MRKITREDALDYHSREPHGKIRVVPTKPTATQHDLSLAYTPGVAHACQAIEDDPLASYRYTARGNLVAVVSNGTAVLGLGDIGALAGKPVMEGKAVLFKRFADVDVFDLELDTHDPEEVIRTVKLLEPTFGGINLEDIKGPECFEIERRLKQEMNIPVFHDDQHGTAIISGAALLNALEVAGKDIGEAKIVFSGAGAAAFGCLWLYLLLGAKRENMLLVDSKGVVYRGRSGAHDAAEGGVRGRHRGPHPGRRGARRRRAGRPVGGRPGDPGHGALDGREPDRLRHGQPDAGDLLGGGHRGAQRRHHGHRPQRLPEPGQQRARLPVHLPRRPRRARHRHQRRDEARRGARARRAGARGRAGLGAQGLRARAPALRARVPDPQAVRPPGAAAGAAGGGAGGDGERRRAGADRRLRGLRAAPGDDHLAPPRGDARRHRPRPPRPEAHRLPGGRGGEDPARRQDPGRPRHRPPGAARQPGEDQGDARRARPRSRGGDHRPGQDLGRSSSRTPSASTSCAGARG